MTREYQPTPKQTLVLWGMLFGRTEAEREPMCSKVRPALSRAERDALVRTGFVDTERRGRAICLVATDRAWAWASEHLDAELTKRSPAGAVVLENVLAHLGRFLGSRDLSLAEFVAHPVTAEPRARDLEERIRQAALAAAGGATKQRVYLKDLRRALGDVSRTDFDSTLLHMQSAGHLVLYPLDNPAEVTAEDASAAVEVGGFTRHIVYLEA